MKEFPNFSALKNARRDSYKIEKKVHDKRFLIFTPHGGGIEPGTTEICKWFSRASFSYYSFTAIGDNCKELHITSHNFDEPELLKLLQGHLYAVSFHGMTDRKKRDYNADVFLGGLHVELRNRLKKKLIEKGFNVATADEFRRSRLAALSPNNVTNRCSNKRGIQIEISESLRRRFFTGDLKRKSGRTKTTFLFKEFCCLIKSCLDNYEAPK